MKKQALILVGVTSLVLIALIGQRLVREKPAKPNPTPRPVYKARTGPKPRFVTYYLGGRHIRDGNWDKYFEQVYKCDPKTEYCIASHDGPDGCEYISELKPNFDEFAKLWFDGSKLQARKELAKFYRGVRIPLRAGNGVYIGYTIKQVEAKIGQPEEKQTFKEYTHYRYIYRGESHYSGRYEFKNGKLISISIREANLGPYTGPEGGCG